MAFTTPSGTFRAVEPTNLEIETGRFVSLVGPSQARLISFGTGSRTSVKAKLARHSSAVTLAAMPMPTLLMAIVVVGTSGGENTPKSSSQRTP